MKSADLKAEPLSVTQLDRWLAGKMPRRILVLPFGGPIPHPISKAGVDLDGEWFDEETDPYGAYPVLRQSRDRLVDWHHTTFQADSRKDPIGGAMKGAILGRVVLDDGPETIEIEGLPFAGIWGDFWANVGERRRQLVAMLEQRAVPLYGSSQPVQAGVRKSKSGHIDVWPIQYHTITTSPQNTAAVVPPLKAALADADATEVSIEALRALAVDLSNLGDLGLTSGGRPGDGQAKSGPVSLEPITTALERLRDVVPTYPRKEPTT